MRALIIIMLASCGAIDVLDGHIDDQQNCCAAATPSRIRACLVRFEGPGWCWEADCLPPIGYIEAYLTEDGEVLDACPAESP